MSSHLFFRESPWQNLYNTIMKGTHSNVHLSTLIWPRCTCIEIVDLRVRALKLKKRMKSEWLPLTAHLGWRRHGTYNISRLRPFKGTYSRTSQQMPEKHWLWRALPLKDVPCNTKGAYSNHSGGSRWHHSMCTTNASLIFRALSQKGIRYHKQCRESFDCEGYRKAPCPKDAHSNGTKWNWIILVNCIL